MQQITETQYFASWKQLFAALCESFSEASGVDESLAAKIQNIQTQLRLFGSPAEELIHEYFAKLCSTSRDNQEQSSNSSSSSLGVLTVSAELLVDSQQLKVSILNGRDLKPHPSKVGKPPDTYVEVQLVAKQLRVKNQKTKTQNKNAFPLYDETFTM